MVPCGDGAWSISIIINVLDVPSTMSLNFAPKSIQERCFAIPLIEKGVHSPIQPVIAFMFHIPSIFSVSEYFLSVAGALVGVDEPLKGLCLQVPMNIEIVQVVA